MQRQEKEGEEGPAAHTPITAEEDKPPATPAVTITPETPCVLAVSAEDRAAAAEELAALGYKEEYTKGIDVMPEFLGRAPTAEEMAQVAEMQRMLEAQGVEVPRRYWEANHWESRVSLFHRYIVANDGHVKLAKDMFVADIAWRDEIKMLELQRMTREAVTGVPDAVFRQHYRAEFLGYDEAEGGNFSPVVYRSLTHLKTWELMTQGCSVEALVKHELWLHEQESRLLFTHPPSFPCRGLIVIIDISHMTMRQATRDVMTIFGAFSNASKPHHPERLTKLYVVGAPRLFPIVWKMLKVFIPRNTYEKIEIHSATDQHPFLSIWMQKAAALSPLPTTA